MSPKTSRASSRRRRSRKKSGQGSAPKPSSPLRPASPTTSSSPNLPRITASRMGSSSLRPQWGRNSSRPCRSGSFTVSGPRQPRRWRSSGSEPGSTSGPDLGLHAATFRESGLLLLRGCARHRRAACPRRPDTKIRRRREHVSRRSLHLRSRARCASRDRRQGLEVLRALRHSRPHHHTQGQVRQLPADHPKPHRSDADQDPKRTRTAWLRTARTSLSGRERRSAPGYLLVFTRGEEAESEREFSLPI